MMFTSILLAFSTAWLSLFSVDTPTTISFTNPSFEDTPRASASPKGWSSNTPGSTPDIMPGAWGIDAKPYEGKTCIGLIARKDGTREDIGQTLGSALEKGKCYSFTIYLAHATTYVGYNKPLRLRVWGGNTAGEKSQLLYTTPLIDNTDWEKFTIELEPGSTCSHIIFEAYYGPGSMRSYDGNILLDNLSVIEICDRA